MRSSSLFMVAMLCTPVAWAQGPAGGSHAATVETLMVLDSKIAMDKLTAQAAKANPDAQGSMGGAAMAPAAPPKPAEKVEVVSILGIGESKKAVILIDGRRFSNLTVGSKAGSYVVRAVGGGCVDLAKSPEKKGKAGARAAVKKVCYDPDAEEEMQLAQGGQPGGAGQGGGIQTRMTIAPLPLPVVPVPSPASRVNPQ